MKINETTIKMWSRIGSRATFGLTALELAKNIDNLMVLTCDVSTSAGLDRYKKAFPNKYLDIGIAEQNLIGVAAGLASEGINVFTTTFAPFQTMRCCEQIKVNLGYMKQKISMVGIASGLVLGPLGYTHCCIEDISIMRSIPGITVISPADCCETVKATLAAAEHKSSVYIRLTGGTNNPPVYKEDYNFEIGKAIVLKEGKDIGIVCTGTMVHTCLEVANELEEQGIFPTIVNMHTIKPIDKDIILQLCKNKKFIITVEEHNILGGLGSAVAEYKSSLKNAPPQLIIGIADYYSKGGDYEFLKEKYGLTSKKIFKKIIENYRKL